MATKVDSSQAVYRLADTGPVSPLADAIEDSSYHQSNGTPPPYSGPVHHDIPSRASTLPSRSLPQLNYSLYAPPNFTLSTDESTITTYKPEPNLYPAALMSIIQAQAALPPKLQIRVKGTSVGGIEDFNIKLNLMLQLVGHNDPSQRWNYLKVVEKGETAWRGDTKMSQEPQVGGGIEAWVRQYCADNSAIKQFTLERVVSNWDTAYLEGRLHSLIASTAYRGQVEISFPKTHSTVIIHSPDKVNRLFTNMTHLFTGTKKYAVVKAVWPYADAPPDAAERQFATQSEESWWNEWKGPIRHAIVNRRKGWVTIEDQIELLMAPREVAKPAEWGTGYH